MASVTHPSTSHEPPGAPPPALALESTADIPEPDEAAPLVLVASNPARRVVLPISLISADKLGVGELLDMADALETDLDGLAAMMRARGKYQGRIVVAFAWILARRVEPAATWDEAQRWRIEVHGEPEKTSKPRKPRRSVARRGSAP